MLVAEVSLALKRAMEMPLIEADRGLLQNAVRVLSYWKSPSIFQLEAIFSRKKFRRRVMAKVPSTEKRALVEFARHFNGSDLSPTAARISQALSQLFASGLFADMVSQSAPKVALLPLMFEKNKVGLFDFRSNELTPKLYDALFSLLWLEHELRPNTSAEMWVVVNGAEKLRPTTGRSSPAPLLRRTSFSSQEPTSRTRPGSR